MKRISNDKISIMFFFLPALCFVIGVCLLIWGIRETAGTRGYEKASGYLYDYTLYSEGGYDASRKTESADTYRLIYRYEVDGREYTLTTSYGTAIVPSQAAERIYYTIPKIQKRLLWAALTAREIS